MNYKAMHQSSFRPAAIKTTIILTSVFFIAHFAFGRPKLASAPSGKREGMNKFLKGVGITLRRDKDSKRPRINKPDSALDREQKEAGEYYYYEN